MSRVRLYFDEDAMQHALLVALRARRIHVSTASDCGMIGKSDPEHLKHASGAGRALYSFNIKDYSLLHEQWVIGGIEHSGIILAFQQLLFPWGTTASAIAPSKREVGNRNAVSAGVSLQLGR